MILLGLALCLAGSCAAVRATPAPDAAAMVPLASPDSFPSGQREAAVSVAAELRSAGEEPSEFFATVTETTNALVFHLWHRSAFAPENANVVGNPGGKCRDAHYDKAKRTITKILYWQ